MAKSLDLDLVALVLDEECLCLGRNLQLFTQLCKVKLPEAAGISIAKARKAGAETFCSGFVLFCRQHWQSFL